MELQILKSNQIHPFDHLPVFSSSKFITIFIGESLWICKALKTWGKKLILQKHLETTNGKEPIQTHLRSLNSAKQSIGTIWPFLPANFKALGIFCFLSAALTIKEKIAWSSWHSKFCSRRTVLLMLQWPSFCRLLPTKTSTVRPTGRENWKARLQCPDNFRRRSRLWHFFLVVGRVCRDGNAGPTGCRPAS